MEYLWKLIRSAGEVFLQKKFLEPGGRKVAINPELCGLDFAEGSVRRRSARSRWRRLAPAGRRSTHRRGKNRPYALVIAFFQEKIEMMTTFLERGVIKLSQEKSLFAVNFGDN